MLFADDAALISHSEEALQRLINCFALACRDFGLTISLKKTNIMGQDVSNVPSICIEDYALEVVENFTYLGSTISSNLSLDGELNIRIGKAATMMAQLSKRAWENTMLTTNTKMRVYQACVLSTLLYGSESWTPYTSQDRIPNKDVFKQAGIPNLFAILTQRCLRWLGHVSRMEDGRIPRDILYEELTTGTRPVGRPFLRYKDVCKRDMKASDINPTSWEALAADHSKWRQVMKTGMLRSDQKRVEQWEEKRKRRRQKPTSTPPQLNSTFTCKKTATSSRIGLYSHSRCCSPNPD
ncbi:hypothetical protein SKAU_G00414960 [Synaphobranchus kaupii]|uniref:Reverse transcriptase domain-containing protein n=1 Tax=Synaphobranchus kaupii TaxID=118154 RepID=A0A9Q1E768_SYNKA|nr:hypothetical protein SKAU_G00414960 [Synaphobranchus kaupii]